MERGRTWTVLVYRDVELWSEETADEWSAHTHVGNVSKYSKQPSAPNSLKDWHVATLSTRSTTMSNVSVICVLYPQNIYYWNIGHVWMQGFQQSLVDSFMTVSLTVNISHITAAACMFPVLHDESRIKLHNWLALNTWSPGIAIGLRVGQSAVV